MCPNKPDLEERKHVPNLANPATDASLLQRYRRGDDDAATELYLRYAERMRTMAVAQTSGDLRQRVGPDDIIQSVFRTFFRRVAQGEYDIPEGDELWKLLLVIGLNKIRTLGAHHGAAKRDVRQTKGGAAFEAALDWEQGSDQISLTILKMTIDELLAPLPESHQQIIQLRIEGHEVNEIAEIAQRSKRSVERILQEFRNNLDKLVNYES